MNSKVTVFTPVYNGISFLKETIESTLNQTYEDFEYLIIDDCSTDDSASLIKSYNDSRINFVQNKMNLKTSYLLAYPIQNETMLKFKLLEKSTSAIIIPSSNIRFSNQ